MGGCTVCCNARTARIAAEASTRGQACGLGGGAYLAKREETKKRKRDEGEQVRLASLEKGRKVKEKKTGSVRCRDQNKKGGGGCGQEKARELVDENDFKDAPRAAGIKGAQYKVEGPSLGVKRCECA